MADRQPTQNHYHSIMEIRDVTPNDFESIAKIYQHYVRTDISTLELPETEPNTQALCRGLQVLYDSGAPFIVGVDSSAGVISGYAYTRPFNIRSGFNRTCEDSIYIHRDYRGRGLGNQLLDRLLDRLIAASRIAQVVAQISIVNGQSVDQVASCRLHASHGFEEVGRLFKVAKKFDQLVDVVTFQLDLTKDS